MLIRQLLVSFGVNITGATGLATFNARIDRAKSSLAAAADTAGGATVWLQSLVRWFARAAVAAGAFGTAMAVNAVTVANNARQIERGAQTLGLTTQVYQEFTGVLAQFGVDAPHVAQVFQHLSAQMEKARVGGLDSAKSFALIGINVNELKGLTVEEVFNRIADGMQATGSASKRLAAANQLLSEETARRFLPALMDGTAGLNRMRRAFVETGAVMDKRTLAAGRRLTDNLTTLKIIVQALRQRIAMALIPVLDELTSTALRWYNANKDLINSKIIEWSEKLEHAWGKIKDRIEEADHYVRTRLNGWGPTIKYTTGLVLTLVAAFYGFKIVGGYMSALASTLTAIAAILDISVGGALLVVVGLISSVVLAVADFVAVWGGAYLVLEDIYYWFTGKGKSAIGAYIADWKRYGGVWEQFAVSLETVKRIAIAVSRILYDLGALAGGAVLAAFHALGINLDDVWWVLKAIGGAIYDFSMSFALIEWTTIATALGKIADALELSAKGLDKMVASANPFAVMMGGVTRSLGMGAGTKYDLANYAPGNREMRAAGIDNGKGTAGDSRYMNYAPVTTYNVQATDPVAVREEIAKYDAEKLRAAKKAARGGDR